MNVTRIYVPGLPDDVGYTSSGCTLSGSIEGSPITGGYGGLDRMYCLPGMSAHVSKIAQLEHYWFVWGALFDDGHWETGNTMLGAGGYAACALFRPGWPVAAIFAVLAASGFFMSFQFTAYNTIAYDEIPPERMSAATSFYATFQQLMLSLGICVGA